MSYRIIWLASGLVLGTIKVLISLATNSTKQRIRGPDTSQAIEGNNIWGFGQWVPVLLLFLPLLSMGEFFYGTLTKP